MGLKDYITMAPGGGSGLMSVFQGPITNTLPQPEPVSLAWLADQTRKGMEDPELIQLISDIRFIRSNDAADCDIPAVIQAMQAHLPVVTIEGVCSRPAIAGLVEPSGYTGIALGLLERQGYTPRSIMRRIQSRQAEMPWAKMVFVTFDGGGVRVVIELDPAPRTTEDMHRAYRAGYYALCLALGLEITWDTVPSSIASPSSMSHDSALHYYVGTGALKWELVPVPDAPAEPISVQGAFPRPDSQHEKNPFCPDENERAAAAHREDDEPDGGLWDFGALPLYLRAEPKLDADRARLVHYCPDRLAVGHTAGRERVMMAAPSGLWFSVDTDYPRGHEYMESLVLKCREMAIAELKGLEGCGVLVMPLQESFGSTPTHYLALMKHLGLVALEPKAFGIRHIPADEIDNRSEHPIIPLASGGGINPRTGETLTADQLEPLMLLDHGWAGAVEPAMDLIGQQPRWSCTEPYTNKWGMPEVDVWGGPIAVMDWFIHEHIGIDCIARIAWLLGGIRDVVDTVSMPPSGCGKGTLLQGLKLALGTGAVTNHMASKSLTTKNTERFTGGTDDATHAILTIIDEADKADIRAYLVNELCDETMSVQRKGRDIFTAKRIGNVVLFAGGWPKADFGSQGVPRRLRWAWEVDKTSISESTRRTLLQPEGIRYLLATLITEGCRLYQAGTDGSCAASEAAVARWKDAVADPILMVLMTLRDERVTPRDFTANAELRTRLANEAGIKESELPSKGRDWPNLIKRAFPQAAAARKTIPGLGQVSGWTGVKLTAAPESATDT